MEQGEEIGLTRSVKNYLLQLEGLRHVSINDLLISENGAKALVSNLDEEFITALLLSGQTPQPKDIFKKAEEGISLHVSSELLGRSINPLGEIIDGGAPLPPNHTLKLSTDTVALGINYRAEIREQLETGITLVDTLVPIGKGQRELIFGEPRSGKTTFLIDILKNQKKSGVICIYTLIGKAGSEITEIIADLKRKEAMQNTIVVASDVRSGAPLIALAPETAFCLADYFRKQGKEVVLVLDDLGAHAKYLREISLLSRTLPGREAYPGDIFYRHAHLMERAGHYTKDAGGGTITLLPVIETELENFSTLIPTNLMASTDGHLYFRSNLRAEGYYPAIDSNESVTRVGKQTQHPFLREIAEKIRTLLAEYEELKNYGIFGTELGDKTQEGLRRGEITQELLKQEPNDYIPINTQILILSLLFTSHLKGFTADEVAKKKPQIIKTLSSPSLQEMVGSSKDLGDLLQKLEKVKLEEADVSHSKPQG